jgi:hypothetical protein
MGNVLTETATVKCAAAQVQAPHGGTVTTPATAATPLLKVREHKVLVATGLPWTVVAGTCGTQPEAVHAGDQPHRHGEPVDGQWQPGRARQ